MPNRRAKAIGELKEPGAQRPRRGTSNNFVAVGTILSQLGVLACVFWAFAYMALFPFILLSFFQRLCLSFYSNMTLVVLLCAMVRVRGRVGTVLFLSRKVAARLSECVDVVEVARLKNSENVASQMRRKETA